MYSAAIDAYSVSGPMLVLRKQRQTSHHAVFKYFIACVYLSPSQASVSLSVRGGVGVVEVLGGLFQGQCSGTIRA